MTKAEATLITRTLATQHPTVAVIGINRHDHGVYTVSARDTISGYQFHLDNWDGWEDWQARHLDETEPAS